ncbi:hypothetical protein NU11F42_42090 [Escherichia coli]
MTDLGGKTSIFSHPVYLFLRKFSLQDSRGGSMTTREITSVFKEMYDADVSPALISKVTDAVID